MDKFKTVLNIVQKQQTTLGFGLVALLTAGGEQVFSAVVFKCPCNSWNFAYGTVFLLVPALALLVLGFILSNKTWKMFTGICVKKPTPIHMKNFCAFLKVFAQIYTTAMVAPISWIAVALLNGVYFECAMTGVNVTLFSDHLCSNKAPQCQHELQLFPCGKSTVPQAEREDVLAIVRAESQVLGWLLIASIMMAALLFTCVARCRSPVSYVHLKFWQMYAQKENELMEKQAWAKVSSFFRFSPREQHYSILHKYVDTNLNPTGAHKPSIRSEGGDFNSPTVLGFVDEGRVML
ncbi:hypothetical protein AGOR_G00204900 [Albula goreensis]|uniref:Uncharacterized protein n=1 Tax=Albula goreensis TaxID=1534307 RepID=A0A8T3CM99_9TELE|nr:hypothetical protein AGOR_G00204900 [Albula goreensis]